MLREEQIDERRRKALTEEFDIKNLGRNRVFSDYQVTESDQPSRVPCVDSRFRLRRQSLHCPIFS